MAQYSLYIQPLAKYWQAATNPEIGASYNIWIEPGKRRWRRIQAGYQNLPDDAGNYTGCAMGVGIQAGTNMSISSCALASDYNVTPAFVQNLDVPFAVAWYKTNLWDEIYGDRQNHQLNAELFADMYSSAKSNATRSLQRALNNLGEQLAVDGGFGALTLAALNRQNSINPEKVYNYFRDQMISFYQSSSSRYKQQWIDSLNRDYPPLEEKTDFSTLLILGGAAAAVVYYIYNKNK